MVESVRRVPDFSWRYVGKVHQSPTCGVRSIDELVTEPCVGEGSRNYGASSAWSEYQSKLAEFYKMVTKFYKKIGEFYAKVAAYIANLDSKGVQNLRDFRYNKIGEKQNG